MFFGVYLLWVLQRMNSKQNDSLQAKCPVFMVRQLFWLDPSFPFVRLPAGSLSHGLRFSLSEPSSFRANHSLKIARTSSADHFIWQIWKTAGVILNGIYITWSYFRLLTLKVKVFYEISNTHWDLHHVYDFA